MAAILGCPSGSALAAQYKHWLLTCLDNAIYGMEQSGGHWPLPALLSLKAERARLQDLLHAELLKEATPALKADFLRYCISVRTDEEIAGIADALLSR